MPEEMAQPEREIRELRNDLRSVCQAQLVQGVEILTALEGLVGAGKLSHEDLQALHADLTPAGGLPASIAGQAAPLDIASPEGGLEVSSPLDTAQLSSAVEQSSETFDSNLWAVAGLASGFAFLWILRKLVLP